MSEPMTPACAVTIADIQRAVSARYGVSIGDLRSQRREPQIVRARFIAIYLARTLTQQSFPVIARLFGGRDHSTVVRAAQQIERRLASDAVLAGELAILTASATRQAESLWRQRMPKAVLAFDHRLNEFGFELAIVPMGSRDENGLTTRKEGTK